MNAPNTLRPVQSSMPGQGNKLVSIIKTGWIVSAEKQIQLFRFNSSDAREYAEFLTNMADVGRVGNSWDFEGRAFFIRALKLSGDAPTAAELQSMKAYLASLETLITTGQEQRPAVKVSGVQYTDPQEFAALSGTGATASTAVSPTSQKGEVGLPVPINIAKGWEIGGYSRCTLPAVPAALYATNQKWAIVLGFVGYEQTY